MSNCAACAFFSKYIGEKVSANGTGTCHANPPVPMVKFRIISASEIESTAGGGIWPIVYGETGWCGLFVKK